MARDTTDAPSLFSIRLNADLQIRVDGKSMSDNCLVVGADGIDGFMLLVDEVLDTLPISHSSYEPLVGIFIRMCRALGQRMSNYTKSHRKQKKAPSGSEKAGSTSDPKEEGKSYSTCSRGSSRSQGRNFDGLDRDDESYLPCSDDDSLYEFEPTAGERERFTRSSSTRAPDEAEPGRRPKAPYPEHIPDPEEFQRPPSPPKSRPQPKPKYRGTPYYKPPPMSAPSDHQIPINCADDLAKIRTSAYLLQAAIEKFLHPDTTHRMPWSLFAMIDSERKRWHKVSLTFHPDSPRNASLRQSTKPEHIAWLRDCDTITKIVNPRFG
ncbi:hypothetical protein C8R43DRAFT_1128389 [Mycena crocata]|nr:hypothetical protein C8R43DRAFT_1128389 [Mycena crocata]